MSEAARHLRAELTERRERLAQYQRDQVASAAALDQLETQLAAERRRHELLGKHVVHTNAQIAAIEAALIVLTERLPMDDVPSVPAPTTAPMPAPAPAAASPSVAVPLRTAAPGKQVAMRLAEAAESIDLGSLSQRTVERAEKVRDILVAANGEPVSFETIIAAMEAHEPTESKARTATEVGLTVLIADGRGRVASAAIDTFKLTPPEYASANLGTRLENFHGRTTTWPKGNDRTPPEGARVKVETGSYEGGQKR